MEGCVPGVERFVCVSFLLTPAQASGGCGASSTRPIEVLVFSVVQQRK
jgi:hypothetical protein